MSDESSQRRATLLLLLGSLAISVLIVEGVSRVVMARFFHGPLIYQEDPYTSFALIPDLTASHTSREYAVWYGINPQGFRGRPVELPKPPSIKHVLVLGDSFVFGMGVEDDEVLSARLRELYETDSDASVEVINGGFAAGKSPDDAHAFLASQRGRSLAPDTVLDFIFVQNDVRDVNEHTWLERDANGFPLRVRSTIDFPNELAGRGPVPYHKSQPILRRLGAVQLLMRAHFALVALPQRAEMLREERNRAPDTSGLNLAITGLHRTAGAMEARFLAAVITTRGQVLGGPDLYHDQVLEQVVGHMTAQGIPYIVLDAAHTGLLEEDFWPHDSHWSASGHRKVAEAVFRVLEAPGPEPQR